ncbi:YciI family protein [Sphaerisporangium fuscum]|uniref:YciI family protein n=1 Tax=Sphaerisporangium fuscum TaxID=2835868 RepID=UPI001BDCCF1C|nr:YciI family protein [Sphaerisporangium fuscum]
MRFMLMMKGDPDSAAAGAPPQELLEAIARHGEEMAKAGVVLDSGGLAPLVTGAQIKVAKGRVSVIDGPFAEAKELVAGYAMVRVGSKEEAVELARRFMEIHREHWAGWEGEAEVRQVFGPEDGGPAPA